MRRAGVGVDIGGCCAAVADEAELAVAVQNLFGHAVKLGYKSVRFNALEVFKHLVLVIALAGLRPRLVDNFFKQFFQLGKSFLGIRCAYIDFHI